MNRVLKEHIGLLMQMNEEHKKKWEQNVEYDGQKDFLDELGLELKIKKLCLEILDTKQLSTEERYVLDRCLQHPLVLRDN